MALGAELHAQKGLFLRWLPTDQLHLLYARGHGEQELFVTRQGRTKADGQLISLYDRWDPARVMMVSSCSAMVQDNYI